MTLKKRGITNYEFKQIQKYIKSIDDDFDESQLNAIKGTIHQKKIL